jgi:2-amino-4-hydroxy-6-hydroxymethyldihydropteridine diphosphokinase
MSTAFIALGSNLDNPAGQLQLAVTEIRALEESSVISVSPVYSSTAVGPGEQPDYLNAVLSLHTRLTPESLLDHLQALENRHGRVRTERWGGRPLDLDILLYDDLKISTERLEVPHPAMNERHFVLYPLADIAGPKMVLPSGAVLGTLLAQCPRNDLVLTEVTLGEYNRAD